MRHVTLEAEGCTKKAPGGVQKGRKRGAKRATSNDKPRKLSNWRREKKKKTKGGGGITTSRGGTTGSSKQGKKPDGGPRGGGSHFQTGVLPCKQKRITRQRTQRETYTWMVNKETNKGEGQHAAFRDW